VVGSLSRAVEDEHLEEQVVVGAQEAGTPPVLALPAAANHC